MTSANYKVIDNSIASEDLLWKTQARLHHRAAQIFAQALELLASELREQN